jgi:uncharacterized membrane-anchored protein
MHMKKWYQSKLVWLGIIMTLSGLLPFVSELVKTQPVTPEAVVAFVGGILTVILRVWFTDTAIQ